MPVCGYKPFQELFLRKFWVFEDYMIGVILVPICMNEPPCILHLLKEFCAGKGREDIKIGCV